MELILFWQARCPVWPCGYWVAVWVATLFGAAIGGYQLALKRGTGTRN